MGVLDGFTGDFIRGVAMTNVQEIVLEQNGVNESGMANFEVAGSAYNEPPVKAQSRLQWLTAQAWSLVKNMLLFLLALQLALAIELLVGLALYEIHPSLFVAAAILWRLWHE
jgi:hypothetical protein